MFHVLSGMFCFITVTISFIYGTRVCWVCGKDCQFEISPDDRREILKSRLPAGFAIYSFGFIVLFSLLFDGAILISSAALISALILSHFVVSMAMPPLKRSHSKETT
jgi:uncharacterized protein (DUF983 family)